MHSKLISIIITEVQVSVQQNEHDDEVLPFHFTKYLPAFVQRWDQILQKRGQTSSRQNRH